MKSILGNSLSEVHTSHVRCILGKVGGSGRIEFTSGDLVSTWSDANLRIGFILGLRLMTYHKFTRTQVQASLRIEKRPMFSSSSVCACVCACACARACVCACACACVCVMHQKVQ